MKSRILIVLLFALSSCGSTEYEKAIADWLQTDENGTWTDLKFELIELLDEKDVTVSDSLLYLDSKAAQGTDDRKSGESSCFGKTAFL